MGSNQSTTRVRPNSMGIRPNSMGTKPTCRIIPGFKFRVLVIGRAKAGKTSIQQRVCETTEYPKIYRGGREVRRGDPNFYPEV